MARSCMNHVGCTNRGQHSVVFVHVCYTTRRVEGEVPPSGPLCAVARADVVGRAGPDSHPRGVQLGILEGAHHATRPIACTHGDGLAWMRSQGRQFQQIRGSLAAKRPPTVSRHRWAGRRPGTG